MDLLARPRLFTEDSFGPGTCFRVILSRRLLSPGDTGPSGRPPRRRRRRASQRRANSDKMNNFTDHRRGRWPAMYVILRRACHPPTDQERTRTVPSLRMPETKRAINDARLWRIATTIADLRALCNRAETACATDSFFKSCRTTSPQSNTPLYPLRDDCITPKF